jgi:hypothetical protein
VLSVPYGFLNDEWMHRTNWSLGGGGASYNRPFGKRLVFDGELASRYLTSPSLRRHRSAAHAKRKLHQGDVT